MASVGDLGASAYTGRAFVSPSSRLPKGRPDQCTKGRIANRLKRSYPAIATARAPAEARAQGASAFTESSILFPEATVVKEPLLSPDGAPSGTGGVELRSAISPVGGASPNDVTSAPTG